MLSGFYPGLKLHLDCHFHSLVLWKTLKVELASNLRNHFQNMRGVLCHLGLASRLCLSTGDWDSVNTTACTRRGFDAISREV